MTPHPIAPLHRRLKLRQIELLAALGEQGSIHRAARALAITQPAASKLLLEAEDALGVRLFDRTRRGVAATPSGAALIARARRLLGVLDAARDEVAAILAGATGLVSVGTYAVAAPVLLPRAVAWLREHHPGLRVRVEEGGTDALLGGLREGSLDCVIGRVLDSDDLSDFDVEHLYHEPIVVVARPRHPLLRRRQRIDWDAVADCDWVLPPPSAPLRRMLVSWFARQGHGEPRCLLESVSILANVTVVRESDALAILPHASAVHYAGLGLIRVLPLVFEAGLPPVSLLRRRGEAVDPSLSAFCAALRAVRPDTIGQADRRDE